MRRDDILETLRRHREELHRLGVQSLALFGSAARDELTEDSDIDVLVVFDGPGTFDGYFDLKFRLEHLLGRPVDLVTDKALRSEIKEQVHREAVYAT